MIHDGQTWVVPCWVVRVLDADTIEVEADLGWHVMKRRLQVRLDRLYCPELGTSEGEAAKRWAQDTLPIGLRMTLVSRWVPTFTRVVGSLYFYPDGSDYARACAAAGHGTLR